VSTKRRTGSVPTVPFILTPTPRCPLHEHVLGLAAVDGGFDWVCPEARWRCGLGDYAEQAWPHFRVGQLAPIPSRRLERHGITGVVRSFGVAEGERGLVATFCVADLTSEVVAALTDAAAPLGVEVREAHREPRRQVAPVLEAAATAPAPAPAVRLLLAEDSARPGGQLTYTVVNDGTVPHRKVRSVCRRRLHDRRGRVREDQAHQLTAPDVGDPSSGRLSIRQIPPRTTLKATRWSSVEGPCSMVSRQIDRR
jgi:hypothetical protein